MDPQQRDLIEQRLIQLIRDISIYNDKMIGWMRQGPEDIRKTHAQFESKLQQLRTAIGEENLTDEARALFDSPSLLTDGSISHTDWARNLIENQRLFAENG